ncbi:MAG: hypothetical protein J6A19_02670 [Oscillospiraceae bacterium]|nr:hypothetical protein [Oscillospiraceae bacterium]
MDKDFIRQICERRLLKIFTGDDNALEDMYKRMNSELETADITAMKRYEILYYMNEIAEEYGTILYNTKGSVVETLLCGGTEEFISDQFIMHVYEPPKPFKAVRETCVTCPCSDVFNNIALVLSKKMDAIIRERSFLTVQGSICDGVEWIPDDNVTKKAIVNFLIWGM